MIFSSQRYFDASHLRDLDMEITPKNRMMLGIVESHIEYRILALIELYYLLHRRYSKHRAGWNIECVQLSFLGESAVHIQDFRREAELSGVGGFLRSADSRMKELLRVIPIRGSKQKKNKIKGETHLPIAVQR